MVEKRFEKLGMPDIERFENYLPTAFNSELTLLQKVNKIIFDLMETNKLTNEMVDYLNKFIEKFDEKLYKTIEDVLKVWLDDGLLADIVREAINEEVIVARTNQHHVTFSSLKQRLDNMDSDFDNNLVYLSKSGVSANKTAKENSDIIEEVMLNSSDNTTFVFPSGKIKIDRTIYLTGKMIQFISYSRTELVADSPMNEMIRFKARTVDDVSQNIKITNIYCNCNNLSNYGINLNSVGGAYTAYVMLDRVFVSKSLLDGILMLAPVWVVYANMCYLESNGRDGFRVEITEGKQSNHLYLDSIISLKNKGHGVSLTGSSHTVFNCDIERNEGFGVFLNGKKEGELKNILFSTRIANNYLEINRKGEIGGVSDLSGGIDTVAIKDNFLNHRIDPEDTVESGHISFFGELDNVTGLTMKDNFYIGEVSFNIDGGGSFSSRCDLGHYMNGNLVRNVGHAKYTSGIWLRNNIPTSLVSGVEHTSNQWTKNVIEDLQNPKSISFSLPEPCTDKLIPSMSITIDSDMTDGIIRFYRIIADSATGLSVDSKSVDIVVNSVGVKRISFAFNKVDILRRIKNNEVVYFRIEVPKRNGTTLKFFAPTVDTTF